MRQCGTGGEGCSEGEQEAFLAFFDMQSGRDFFTYRFRPGYMIVSTET
jgi:hypothetical protein